MEYISKNLVLEYVDRMLKNSDISGVARVELQRLSVNVLHANEVKLKRDEESVVGMPKGGVALTFCSECRNMVRDGDKFCSKCGRRLVWTKTG